MPCHCISGYRTDHCLPADLQALQHMHHTGRFSCRWSVFQDVEHGCRFHASRLQSMPCRSSLQLRRPARKLPTKTLRWPRGRRSTCGKVASQKSGLEICDQVEEGVRTLAIRCQDPVGRRKLENFGTRYRLRPPGLQPADGLWPSPHVWGLCACHW